MKRSTPVMAALVAFGLALGATSCGKKQVGMPAFDLNPEEAAWSVNCITEPITDPARKVDPFSGKSTVFDPPLPERLPTIYVPVEIGSCGGLNDEPKFPGKLMPALIARVDCNARVVHFRTSDYQVFEVARIAPTGDIDAKMLYITRLVEDADGPTNCWRRFIGHVAGNISCNEDPNAARLNFKVTWTVDMTPPEIMEPPTPGQADHRNGKFCRLESGQGCTFSNQVEMGCGG